MIILTSRLQHNIACPVSITTSSGSLSYRFHLVRVTIFRPIRFRGSIFGLFVFHVQIGVMLNINCLTRTLRMTAR